MGSIETQDERSSPRRWRRWFRFSLATLLVLVTVLGVCLGLWVNRAQRQKRAVAALRGVGVVRYDYEVNEGSAGDRLPGPDWPNSLLGIDYYADVVEFHSSEPIAAADLELLKDLSGLKRLRLSSIGDEEIQRLSRLSKLTDLDLSKANLSGDGLRQLAVLPRLESLRLNGIGIGDADLAQLCHLSHLKRLSLDGTAVTDAGLRHLGRLAHIEHLDVAEIQITDAGLVHLAGMSGLTSLALDHSQITGSGLLHLAGLKQLQSLSLVNTPITDAALIHFAGLHRLRHLSFYPGWARHTDCRTEITPDGYERLRQMLPNCIVYEGPLRGSPEPAGRLHLQELKPGEEGGSERGYKAAQ